MSVIIITIITIIIIVIYYCLPNRQVHGGQVLGQVILRPPSNQFAGAPGI